MIKFILIIALLYVLFYGLKLTRYNQAEKKIMRHMMSGLILLIASLYLRTDSLGARSSTYIQLIYGLSPLITVGAIFLLLGLILKYRKELFQTTQQLIKDKRNVFEIAVLTILLIATAVDTSLWAFIGTFAITSILIAREAYVVALKRNNEARA